MGKPDKQFTDQSRNARCLSEEQAARLGAMSPQSKVSFPLHFRQLADAGVIPFLAAPPLTNRAADTPRLRPRPTELSNDRSSDRFGARAGIGGWHREDFSSKCW